MGRACGFKGGRSSSGVLWEVLSRLFVKVGFWKVFLRLFVDFHLVLELFYTLLVTFK